MRSCACVFTKIYKPSFLAGNLCPKKGVAWVEKKMSAAVEISDKFGFEKKYRDSIVYRIHGYIEYE